VSSIQIIAPPNQNQNQFKNLDQSTATVQLDIPAKPQARTAQKVPPMIVRFKHYNTRKVGKYISTPLHPAPGSIMSPCARLRQAGVGTHALN